MLHLWCIYAVFIYGHLFNLCQWLKQRQTNARWHFSQDDKSTSSSWYYFTGFCGGPKPLQKATEKLMCFELILLKPKKTSTARWRALVGGSWGVQLLCTYFMEELRMAKPLSFLSWGMCLQRQWGNTWWLKI